MRSVVTVPVENTGGSCTIEVPAKIVVQNSEGAEAVVGLLGKVAKSFSIAAGGRVSLVLEADWLVSGGPPPGAVYKCEAPIEAVTSLELPTASGRLAIELGTTWHQVCTSPASVWMTVLP